MAHQTVTLLTVRFVALVAVPVLWMRSEDMAIV
jgi:hypothetical protein